MTTLNYANKASSSLNSGPSTTLRLQFVELPKVNRSLD